MHVSTLDPAVSILGPLSGDYMEAWLQRSNAMEAGLQRCNTLEAGLGARAPAAASQDEHAAPPSTTAFCGTKDRQGDPGGPEHRWSPKQHSCKDTQYTVLEYGRTGGSVGQKTDVKFKKSHIAISLCLSGVEQPSNSIFGGVFSVLKIRALSTTSVCGAWCRSQDKVLASAMKSREHSWSSVSGREWVVLSPRSTRLQSV